MGRRKVTEKKSAGESIAAIAFQQYKCAAQGTMIRNTQAGLIKIIINPKP